MKYIRSITILAFLIAVLGYFGLVYYHNVNSDQVAPVISSTSDHISVSLSDGEEKLLEGLSAFDDRDGDLTSEIIVENLSLFKSDKTRDINYVVCDSANNTARYTRSVSYTDYESPKFSLKEPLRFPEGKKINLTDYLTANDLFDGDLSKKIQMIDQDYYSFNRGMEVGKNVYKFHASNTAGDTSYVDILVNVEEEGASTYVPYVNLSEYIVYIKKGKSFNPYQYIEDVTIGVRKFDITTSSDKVSASEGKVVKGLFGDLSKRDKDDELISEIAYSDIYIDNPVDCQTPGNYVVTYQITTQDRVTGTTGLSVVIEE